MQLVAAVRGRELEPVQIPYQVTVVRTALTWDLLLRLCHATQILAVSNMIVLHNFVYLKSHNIYCQMDDSGSVHFSAIDGNYTEWTEWSDCTATCGGGSKTRIRTCTNPPPQHGGNNCVELGPDAETVKCSRDPCRE